MGKQFLRYCTLSVHFLILSMKTAFMYGSRERPLRFMFRFHVHWSLFMFRVHVSPSHSQFTFQVHLWVHRSRFSSRSIIRRCEQDLCPTLHTACEQDMAVWARTTARIDERERFIMRYARLGHNVNEISMCLNNAHNIRISEI